MRLPSSCLLLCLPLLLLIPACAQEEASAPLAPEASVAALDGAGSGRGPTGHYPLQSGNRWSYQARVVFTRILEEGGPQPPEVVVRHEVKEIVGHQEDQGRCYVVQRSTLTEDPGEDPLVGTLLLRQDASGLYEADLPVVGGVAAATLQLRPDVRPDAAERARQVQRERMELARRLGAGLGIAAEGRPGGVLDGEIQRLAYPLHPGREWTVREEPLFHSWVDGREILDLPSGRTAAWRVGIRSPLFGENDRYFFFYGQDGYVGLRGHAETELVKEDGEPIGILILEDQEWLESVEIHRDAPTPCDAPGGKPRDMAHAD